MTERQREIALMVAESVRRNAEQESLRQHSQRMAEIAREFHATVRAVNEEYTNAGQQ